MSYSFFEYTKSVQKEWDDFVKHHPLGSIHQLSIWRKLQQKIPGRGEILGFGVKKNGKILATTFCVKMETGFFGKHWYYSPRGPVFDIENPEPLSFLIEKVLSELTAKKGIFWRFDPYLPPNKTLPQNFQIEEATQDYQPTDTLEIDLTLPKDDILAQMKRRGRNGINKALKKEVCIETITKPSPQDIEDFYRLSNETTDRDGFSGHPITYYHHFLKELNPYAVLFFATYEGQRIASAISTFCGDKAIYYFGASTSNREYNKIKAPTLLQWSMIQYAKSQGCKTYDFLGISPENQPDHAYAGISQFKHGFGGYRKCYQPGKEITISPFWHGLYRFIKKLKK